MKYKAQFQKFVDDEYYEKAWLFLYQYDIFKFEDSFYFSNMGWILNQLQRYLEASFYLSQGLKYFHDEAWLFAQYAYSLSKLKRYAEAIHFFKRAIAMGMQESWMYIELGTCCLETNDFNSALLYFEDALLDDPNNSWLLQQCAHIYENQQSFAQALEYYHKSFILSQDDTVLQDYIYLLIFLNKYYTAYDFLINCDENNITHLLLAEICLYIQEYEEGLSYLSKVNESHNLLYHFLSSQYYYLLDRIDVMNEHLDISFQLLNEMIMDNKFHLTFIKDFFLILEKTKGNFLKLQILDYMESFSNYKMWLYEEYIKTYSDIHMHRDAIIYCERYLNEFNNTKFVLDSYAWNLRLEHRNHEAIDILLKRTNIFEVDAWSINELARNYIDIEDFNNAIYYYEELISYDIDHLHCFTSLAWAYFKIRNYTLALFYLDKAKNIENNDDKVLNYISELYVYIHEGIRNDKSKEKNDINTIY